MLRTSRVIPFVAGAFLLGCSDAGGSDTGVIVRDSAGVTIVENHEPVWRDGEAWTIAPDPRVEIGMVEGPPEYQLDRVGDAKRLQDGGLAIANGGTEIRFYDPAGRYVRTVGRQGDGPGEFQGLSLLFPTSDSLFAYDQRPRRISVFDQAGGFVRSTTLGTLDGSGFPNVVGRFADGSFLATVTQAYGPGGVEDGTSRRPVAAVRYDAEGVVLDTLATLPGHESFVQTQDRGFTVTSLLFGRNPVRAAAGEVAALGGNDSYQLEVYTPDGATQRIVRRSVAPRPVTDADWEALRAERLEGLEGDWRPRIESMIAEMPRAATMPSYSSAVLDEAGNLWVEDFSAPGDPAPSWSVFDEDGRWLGRLETPDRFRVTQIGSDFIVGVWRDDLDVEHVRVHALVKPRS